MSEDKKKTDRARNGTVREELKNRIRKNESDADFSETRITQRRPSPKPPDESDKDKDHE